MADAGLVPDADIQLFPGKYFVVYRRKYEPRLPFGLVLCGPRTFGLLRLGLPHPDPRIGPLSSYFPSSAGFARLSSNRLFSRTEQICW